jgi:tetratricopeptide (TPR) repeat protein
MGHLSGALCGAVFGLAFLRLNWVDCENWDLLAVFAGRKGKPPGEPQSVKFHKPKNPKLAASAKAKKKAKNQPTNPDAPQTPAPDKATAAFQKVTRQIEAGDVDGAFAAYDRAARTIPNWPSRPQLNDLIKAFSKAEAWDPAAKLLADAILKDPDHAARARLKLAQILIAKLQRPAKALRILEPIPPDSLPPDLKQIRDHLTTSAANLRDNADFIEIDDEH